MEYQNLRLESQLGIMNKNYNCYNIAHKYLKSKYNIQPELLPESGRKLMRYPNKKQREITLKSFTNRDYCYSLHEEDIIDVQDKEILSLMKIYNISVVIKKELYYKLIELGVKINK